MSKPPFLPKIIAVVGPTASGKTALAIKLAQKFNGEIVSADSRQVYRGMDIGTAKPTRAEQDAVPHHLVDIKNPDEDYTVADYKRDSAAAIRDILTRGRLPVLVGGTGLYVKSILENLDIPRVSSNPELRTALEAEIHTKGLATLFEKLVAIDPEAAYIVDPKNPRRVVRALEVALVTGEPFTAQRTKHAPLFDALAMGMNPPADILRQRIDARIDRMIQDGLVKEVDELIKKYGGRAGHDALPSAFDAIGYREIVDYLRNKISPETAVAEMKMNTWHYAKRQMTWFRKDKNIHWLQPSYEVIHEAAVLVDNFLLDKME